MSEITSARLAEATGLDIYDSSIVEDANGVTYFLARRDGEKVVGSVSEGVVSGKIAGVIDDQSIVIGPCNTVNANAIRFALPWTAPVCLGLATSAGLGDRLGLATPGHIRAIRAKGGNVRPILAQQSIREMTRTQRTPQEVMDAATWGVLQEGYTDGFGSDADHLQTTDDIDVTLEVGFTFFTIDPGKHVDDEADNLDAAALAERYEKLDFAGLEISAADLTAAYSDKKFALAGGDSVGFTGDDFLRAAVKYGNAIAHVARMYRHLQAKATWPVELEVSVDETESPTTVAEHFFFASELKRLGVEWVSMAPRFVGRMEKGVDYIGDLEEFRKSFAGHVAVMRTIGPYKISIHSGSDKFSIYPETAEMTAGLVHLKTAGTSYLEAIRAIGKIDPALFRRIYDFAREHYDEDKKTYHVSADMAKVPPASAFGDHELADRIDDFDTRQALHCTFGSVLTTDGGELFKRSMYEDLLREEEIHYEMLAKHLGRHVEPFAKYAKK